jgi:hypothetical protein
MKQGNEVRNLFSVVLALASGLLLTFLFHPSAAAPAAVEHPFAAEVGRLSNRFHARPVLRGESLQGNAAELYLEAASQFIVRGEGDPEPASGTGPTESKAVWLTVNREAAATLRRGTRCFCSRLFINPIRGYEAGTPEGVYAPRLVDLLVETAMEARAKGDVPEALRILMDGARFGQDLARGGGMWHRVLASKTEMQALNWAL